MSAVRVKNESRKSKAAESTQEAAAVNQVAITAAVFESLGRLAADAETTGVSRDDIPDGSAYTIELAIVARIQGQILRRFFDVALTTGHTTETAVSHTPGGDKRLIAYVLGKLNAATREAILRDVPEEYAGDELPPVDETILKSVEGLLKSLRAGRRQVKRGDVTCKAVASQPPLSIFA